VDSAPDTPVRLYAYAPEQVPLIWPEVKDYIDSALIENGHLILQDVYDSLLLNQYQLWTPISEEIEAAIVTTIYDVRGVKNCTFIACGGKSMDKWVSLIPQIEEWAKENGCRFLKIYGRRGWAKVFGYDIVSTEMRKDLWDS
jgi:hypothetical protein